MPCLDSYELFKERRDFRLNLASRFAVLLFGAPSRDAELTFRVSCCQDAFRLISKSHFDVARCGPCWRRVERRRNLSSNLVGVKPDFEKCFEFVGGFRPL